MAGRRSSSTSPGPLSLKPEHVTFAEAAVPPCGLTALLTTQQRVRALSGADVTIDRTPPRTCPKRCQRRRPTVGWTSCRTASGGRTSGSTNTTLLRAGGTFLAINRDEDGIVTTVTTAPSPRWPPRQGVALAARVTPLQREGNEQGADPPASLEHAPAGASVDPAPS